jgi:hypothetical protein
VQGPEEAGRGRAVAAARVVGVQERAMRFKIGFWVEDCDTKQKLRSADPKGVMDSEVLQILEPPMTPDSIREHIRAAGLVVSQSIKLRIEAEIERRNKNPSLGRDA